MDYWRFSNLEKCVIRVGGGPSGNAVTYSYLARVLTLPTVYYSCQSCKFIHLGMKIDFTISLGFWVIYLRFLFPIAIVIWVTPS